VAFSCFKQLNLLLDSPGRRFSWERLNDDEKNNERLHGNDKSYLAVQIQSDQ
jgi:hypothetical protein